MLPVIHFEEPFMIGPDEVIELEIDVSQAVSDINE